MAEARTLLNGRNDMAVTTIRSCPRAGMALGAGFVAVLFLTGALTGFISGPAGAGAGAGAASKGLSVKPKTLVLPKAQVSEPCESGGCTYAWVKITNDTSTGRKMTKSSGTTPFWSTSAGSCNDPDDFVVPPDDSCSLEFGFAPTTAGTTYHGTGTIDFHNGTVLTFHLRGSSKKV